MNWERIWNVSLPEAMFIVAENKNGWREMTWMEYFIACSIVDEHFPITGYTLLEDDGEYEMGYVNWRKNADNVYSQKQYERVQI